MYPLGYNAIKTLFENRELSLEFGRTNGESVEKFDSTAINEKMCEVYNL